MGGGRLNVRTMFPWISARLCGSHQRHKNLLHRFLRIRRFSIPHSTRQTQLSKAGTVLGEMVEEYSHKINVRKVSTSVYVKVRTQT
jgi:hypothetical protein